MKIKLPVLLFLFVAALGCKKSEVVSKSQIVTCDTKHIFLIASNGSSYPDLHAMPGDTINFQAWVLVQGKYPDYQPGTLAGCAILWDFGDGGTSTALSPNHVYDSSCTYSVQLILNHDTTNIISSSIYLGPHPMYTHLVAGIRQWKRTRVKTVNIYAANDTLITDTTFAITIVDQETISIGSVYLHYIPFGSTVNNSYYSSSGGWTPYALNLNNFTAKIYFSIDYGWQMTDNFESM